MVLLLLFQVVRFGVREPPEVGACHWLLNFPDSGKSRSPVARGQSLSFPASVLPPPQLHQQSDWLPPVVVSFEHQSSQSSNHHGSPCASCRVSGPPSHGDMET